MPASAAMMDEAAMKEAYENEEQPRRHPSWCECLDCYEEGER